MAQNSSHWMKKLLSNRFLQTGVPFVIFVVGGSYFLKQFASVRYEFRKGRKLTLEEAERMGFKSVDVKTVTGELLKEIEKGDLDTWSNIRGPRPWEDSKTYQTEERRRLSESDNKS